MAQHAFTVSTGEPVGMVGAGIVGVLWGGPKDDGVPAIGTRSVLFLVARRAVWPGRGRPCVGGEGGGLETESRGRIRRLRGGARWWVCRGWRRSRLRVQR